MILIADGGSTKTEWRSIDTSPSERSVLTAGINPYFLSADEIYQLISRELKPLAKGSPEKIYFYGTGCNSETKNNKVESALKRVFHGCEIFIGSDLLGAARSLCQDGPGIACIMGTGSNSCYYDGSGIISNVAPLGYILGDEGGGAVLGKKLISAVLKKQVSDQVIEAFFSTYKMTTAEILDCVYMKPFPNRFLGQFAKFISANIQFPELQDIIISSFDDFIKRNILQYPESEKFPVHFTGSIAFYFRQFLEAQLKKNNLKTGKITLSPMPDLVRYHLDKIKNFHYGQTR
jgi:N-acetylglucosamine kinase-like BadF-type ATPase